jgi:CRISPR-associated protein Cas5d
MKNEVTFKVYGKYALFTDPLTKIGGEKSSLMLPTYQALKGICESLYWKPSIIWFVDKVHIINPIKTESKGIRPIKYNGGNDLSYYTYLSDVEYIVTAHFEFNINRPDLKQDRNENKHYFIAKRSIEKGGRRDIFLGTRECQGYVETVTGEVKGYYDDMGEMTFGLQYHSLSYPDENEREELWAKFWYPKMENGIIEFCRPEHCPKENFIRKMPMKTFNNSNFSGLDEPELLDGYVEGGEA